MAQEEEASYLHKEPCPNCGSKDNLGRYSDGHGYCFGCGHYEHGDGTAESSPSQPKSKGFIHGEYQSLGRRKITEETCRKFKYTVGELKGKPVQIAQYHDADGKIIGQKWRKADKTFGWTGTPKEAALFGQNLWRDGGKMIVVTEGEIDCMTVSQLQSNKWPVVSVRNGAQGAKKCLALQLTWLLKFDTIVLMFDDDAPGQKASKECAALFPAGRCKIAKIEGFKDPNAALQAGSGAKVIEAMWAAKEYRPDGILSLKDITEDISRPLEQGRPWFDDRLNDLTFGRRQGEVVGLGAGTGIGKTDFITQQIEYDLTKLGLSVAAFFLEQSPRETGLRIVGKFAGKRFHVPDSGWTPKELEDSTAKLMKKGHLFLYDSAGASFGATSWEILRDRIRFLVHSSGVQVVYIDNLTALAAAEDDERKALEIITAEMAGLAQELNVWILFVSHLATPEGKPHEEGGRVMIRHFKGSRNIGFWSHFIFGLERDQQAKDKASRSTTALRVLKDRYTGQSVGTCIHYGYEHNTGRLVPCDPPEPKERTAKDHGFTEDEHGDF